jgi:hypothetical protein
MIAESIFTHVLTPYWIEAPTVQCPHGSAWTVCRISELWSHSSTVVVNKFHGVNQGWSFARAKLDHGPPRVIFFTPTSSSAIWFPTLLPKCVLIGLSCLGVNIESGITTAMMIFLWNLRAYKESQTQCVMISFMVMRWLTTPKSCISLYCSGVVYQYVPLSKLYFVTKCG